MADLLEFVIEIIFEIVLSPTFDAKRDRTNWTWLVLSILANGVLITVGVFAIFAGWGGRVSWLIALGVALIGVFAVILGRVIWRFLKRKR
jgi:ABC-type multidrug transport system fused ATPase/permease subunit